jgi:hypothetical protein
MRDSYRKSDFHRLERGRYCGRACPRCASLRVHFRMQPRFVQLLPKQLFKGYTLGWSCEVCGLVWFE